MTIDSGNVGIGTTTPGAKLEVSGTSSDVEGNHYARFGRNFGWRIDAATGQNLILEGNNTGDWSQAITVNRVVGNVGIGTTTPLANNILTLSGAGNNAIAFDAAGVNSWSLELVKVS